VVGRISRGYGVSRIAVRPFKDEIADGIRLHMWDANCSGIQRLHDPIQFAVAAMLKEVALGVVAVG